MKVFIIIYNIVAMLIACSTLGYVTTDIILEYNEKRKASQIPVEPMPEPEPEIIPEPEPEPEEMPEVVDHINAEEADSMISDNLAMSKTIVETGAGAGYKTYINIGTLDENFEAGETITLDLLKQRGLVMSKAQRIKILAHGELTKPLTVKAESFSMQAIKMIELTGGQVVILR